MIHYTFDITTRHSTGLLVHESKTFKYDRPHSQQLMQRAYSDADQYAATQGKREHLELTGIDARKFDEI